MMIEISDEHMQQMLGRSRAYTVVLLSKGPNYRAEGDRSILREHARRNLALRAAGTLPVVVPLGAEDGSSDVVGVGIFTTTPEETRALLADDPAVMAGWLTAEVRQGRSFPGDALP
jgi:hypothetical protein